MLATGLMSLLMIVMAPIIGVKRITKALQPIWDLLRHVPYCTFIVTWLSDWLDGDVSFEDLPQNHADFKEACEQMDEKDGVTSGLEELSKAHKKFSDKCKKDDVNSTTVKSFEDSTTSNERKAAAAARMEAKYRLDFLSPHLYMLVNEKSKMQTRFGTTTLIPMLHSMAKMAPLEKIRFEVEVFTLPEFSEKFRQKFGVKTAFEAPVNPNTPEGISDEVTADNATDNTTSTFTTIVSDDSDTAASTDDGAGVFVKDMKPQMVPATPEGEGGEAAELWTFQKWWARFTAVKEKEVSREPDVPSQEEVSLIMSDIEKKNYEQVVGHEMTHAQVKDFLAKMVDEPTPTEKALNEAWVGWPSWLRTGFENSYIRNGTIFATFFAVSYGFTLVGLEIAKAMGSFDGETEAHPQAKGKNKGNKRGRARRFNARSGFAKFQPSGGGEKDPEQITDQDRVYTGDHVERDEYSDEEDVAEDYRWALDNEHLEEARSIKKEYESRPRGGYRKPGIWQQSVTKADAKVVVPPKVPSMKADDVLRRAIYKAKHRKVKVSTKELAKFVAQAKATYSKAMSNGGKDVLRRQAFNPHKLADGVFKIYADGVYCCTGTQVGNKMFVVAHCLSEDSSITYKAVNNKHTISMKGSDATLVTKELVCFPVNGISSPFTARKLKVLENAAIVTIYGYGSGVGTEPDSITGFASPLGWCNAATRDGDCTSPVLDVDGNIVGFWTHGNGKDFGKFDLVDASLKEFVSTNQTVNHVGLDFQSGPLPQVL